MRKLFAIFALVGSAVSASFASGMTTNEVYTLMRDALHPKIRAQLTALDADYFASCTNGLTSTVHLHLSPSPNPPSNLILDWIVHVSLPNVTNETAYFDSYKNPLTNNQQPTTNDFFTLLTNRASRLSYIPPIPRLSLANYTRPEPGIDYPGVSYEDEGTTPACIRLTLRAPKSYRKFRIDVDVRPKKRAEYEVKWMLLQGVANVQNTVPQLQPDKPCFGHVGLSYNAAKSREMIAAVFVREKGGLWGAPAFVKIDADPLCTHHYDKRGRIEYIDYGAFRDWYKLDDQNRILGFTRMLPGMVRGDDYTNFGEKIIETYPGDKPKITHKMKCAVVDGKLTYIECNEDIHYKNGPFLYRPNSW